MNTIIGMTMNMRTNNNTLNFKSCVLYRFSGNSRKQNIELCKIICYNVDDVSKKLLKKGATL